jgi:hypothetical protein
MQANHVVEADTERWAKVGQGRPHPH